MAAFGVMTFVNPVMAMQLADVAVVGGVVIVVRLFSVWKDENNHRTSVVKSNTRQDN